MGRGRETLRFGGKVHVTERFERHRIRDPNDFIEGSFRTHDIGKRGFSKRIAGRLKSTGEWATQSLLISRDEPPAMKKQLRRNAENMLVWSKESPELKTEKVQVWKRGVMAGVVDKKEALDMVKYYGFHVISSQAIGD